MLLLLLLFLLALCLSPRYVLPRLCVPALLLCFCPCRRSITSSTNLLLLRSPAVSVGITNVGDFLAYATFFSSSY